MAVNIKKCAVTQKVITVWVEGDITKEIDKYEFEIEQKIGKKDKIQSKHSGYNKGEDQTVISLPLSQDLTKGTCLYLHITDENKALTSYYTCVGSSIEIAEEVARLADEMGNLATAVGSLPCLPTTPPPPDIDKAKATLIRLNTELDELEKLPEYKIVKKAMADLNKSVQELKKGYTRSHPFLKTVIELNSLVTSLDKQFDTISQRVSRERTWLTERQRHLSPDNAGQIADQSRQKVLELLKDIKIRLPKMAASIRKDKLDKWVLLGGLDNLRKPVGDKFECIGNKAKKLYNKEMKFDQAKK